MEMEKGSVGIACDTSTTVNVDWIAVIALLADAALFDWPVVARRGSHASRRIFY